MRVVDADFNVIRQDTDMTELTGIDANSRDVKCHEQLSGPDCQTDSCPLNQLQEEAAQNELRYGDGEVLVREVTKKLPNGERKHFSMVAEPITDDSGEIEEVIQSWKVMHELKQDQDLPSRFSVPEPKDTTSFRRALSEVLNQAAMNDVEFANRSWESSRVGLDRQWDVEITTLQTHRHKKRM